MTFRKVLDRIINELDIVVDWDSHVLGGTIVVLVLRHLSNFIEVEFSLSLPVAHRPELILRVHHPHVVLPQLCHSPRVREGSFHLHLEEVPGVEHLQHGWVKQYIWIQGTGLSCFDHDREILRLLHHALLASNGSSLS